MLKTSDLANRTSSNGNTCEAILFDLGKVLIPFDFTIAYTRMAADCGRTADQVRSLLSATTLYRDFESGDMAGHDFAEAVSREVGYRGQFNEFCNLWNSIFLPEPLLPVSLIEDLRKRYRTFIVSNTNEIHFEMLRRTYPILEHFDGYVLSYEVRAMKPHTSFYQAALKAAGCPAEKCIFIDDLVENVAGAQAAGMDTVHFVGRANLESELKRRGLLPELDMP